MTTSALLVLADGSVFHGTSVGYHGTTSGEVVFNTSMTGYQEILTDPSYAKQIVTLTYPHIGNTGTTPEDAESNRVWSAGLVIRDLPLENVAALQRFISDAKSELATLAAMVQTGLELRYADAAKAQLLAKGQDTGTTHIEDAGFDITVEIGKDVKYEPKGLTELVAKIEANGGDPREYVEIKYSVSEAKFKAWPQTLRAPFEALRTVTPKASPSRRATRRCLRSCSSARP